MYTEFLPCARTIYKNKIRLQGETLKGINSIDWSAIEHLWYKRSTNYLSTNLITFNK